MDFQTLKLNSEKPVDTIKTNWVVITGAPSSGKTSVISALSDLGYNCYPEVARTLLEQSPGIRNDEEGFQRLITASKSELENSLNPKNLIFLDRGMPDSITYYRVAGINPHEAAISCHRFQYKHVFVFDPVGWVDDGVRNEGAGLARVIDTWLEKDYQALGYCPIRTPLLSICERTELILSKIA